MYPTAFTYHRAKSVSDAIATLGAHPDAKLLAGGHSLIPTMKLRLASPPTIVDLGGIAELRGIKRAGASITIGALTTHREIEFSKELAETCPILPEAAALIGDPMVRNRGTIGGSLAHADPAADYPAVVLALGATMRIEAPSGGRNVRADDFFTGMFATSVAANEVLTEVHVPVVSKGTGTAYEKLSHPASRYSVVGVAAVVTVSVGVCRGARVAITGAGPSATRLQALETALAGTALDEAALATICRGLVDPGGLLSDQFASAEYRAHLVDVLARRAIARAAARARG